MFVLLSLLVAANLSQGEPEAPEGKGQSHRQHPRKDDLSAAATAGRQRITNKDANANVLFPVILRKGSAKQSNCRGKQG
jgi:hypothetical protein